MNKKALSTITILATALLMTIPTLPLFARAQGGTSLAVTPSLSTGELGDHFTVNVQVSDVSNLVVYAFILTYDTRVLSVSSTSLGGTLFDVNNNGDISDDPVLVAVQDVLEGLGQIRYTVGLLGYPPISVPGSASLLSVDFMVDSLGTSPIELGVSSLVVDNGSGVQRQPHDTMDGEYRTSHNLMFANPNRGCSGNAAGVDRDRVKLKCIVTNTGSLAIEVAAEFMYQSDGGESGSARTASVMLAPGETRAIMVRITVPAVPDTYHVQGTAVRVVMGPDGLMDIPGPESFFDLDTGL